MIKLNTLFRIGAIALSIAPTLKSYSEDRPNIIIILSDDMGYSDAGCFGGEIETPNLDTLAANGLRFTEFYNSGRCWPTRATLISGRYAESIGPKQTTIPTVLKTAGYQTAMAGKWHLSTDPKSNNAPAQRGFDSFYGTMNGGGSYYNPDGLARNAEFTEPDSEGFYYTNKIGEEAVLQIEEFSKSEKPFFQYIAYTAPHWPLHAPEEMIQKYIPFYKDGWEKLRNDRYARMLEMGILDAETSPLPAMESEVEDWETIEHKDWHARNMAIYAAMVDIMDQSIGKVIDALKRTKQYDNTLIIFFHDNGACHEIPKPESYQRTLGDDFVNAQSYDIPMGGPKTFAGVGPNWANAQNTPLRKYKNNSHQGGSCTPAIMHWPNGISLEPGSFVRQRGHAVDLLATCIDLANAQYPSNVLPHEGISLVPALNGEQLPHEHPYYFVRGNKSRAFISGDYKIVRDGNLNWELYNLKNDFSETNNLATQYPERVSEMEKRWKSKKWIHPRVKSN